MHCTCSVQNKNCQNPFPDIHLPLNIKLVTTFILRHFCFRILMFLTFIVFILCFDLIRGKEIISYVLNYFVEFKRKL